MIDVDVFIVCNRELVTGNWRQLDRVYESGDRSMMSEPKRKPETQLMVGQ